MQVKNTLIFHLFHQSSQDLVKREKYKQMTTDAGKNMGERKHLFTAKKV